MRNKIIEIAVAEIGYKEGAGNSNKYSKELYGKSQEWCNDFICWCARKAGISEDVIPAFSYVPYTANWYDERKLYKNSKAKGENYTPQKGDIILFDYNRNTTSDHIGLVEKIENGKVYSIEGNKDNMVKRCEYNLDSADIRAYCIPNYPITKVLKSVEEIAKEVLDGKWNVYPKRKELLENAGYNYNEVQTKVNELLRGATVNKKYKVVTAKSGLNIRNAAKTSAKRIGGVAYNTKVEVLQENVAFSDRHNWDKVKFGNITGYVANTYLK